MLHVGIDATSWVNERGFGRFTREIVTALASRHTGFRYTLVMDQQPRDVLPAGVQVITAGTARNLNETAVGTTSRSIAYLWRMSRAVRAARFDVFFFPAVYSYFPLATRVPCIVCYHDTTAERFPELLFPTRLNRTLWQIKTILAKRQTTRAMTVSQASARDLETFLGISKTKIDIVTEAADPVFRVLSDGSRLLKAREKVGIPANSQLLVHVGGLNPHKNLLRLLEAMQTVIAERHSVHLAIVGDTSGKGFWDNINELKQFVNSHSALKQHVHFTGYLSDTDVCELLNSSESLVFPSLWEGFGLPAVEAMSCGTPVLASHNGSLPEVVGDAGLFFDPEDPAAIANCILTLFRDRDLRRRLAEKARERSKLFTWERAAELAEECFRRCYEEALH